MAPAPVGGGKGRALLGAALVACCWPASWLLAGLRTQFLFFPLWLGYVLLLDGLTELRDGTSLAGRSRPGFARLFLLSVPLWWLFELANRHLGNWEYLGREHFGDLEYALWCSLAFTTVIPAVLVSAEWVRGMAWVERCAHGPRLAPTRARLTGLFLAGLALLALLFAWPRQFYPCLWIAGVFLLEPLVHLRGRRALLADLARGDWRPWVSLWTGVLLCGFFWELWNVRSFPKWVYHVPGMEGPKLFEMPLAGYLGYLPFALEVYLWKELWLVEPELLRGRRGRGQAPASRIAVRADARPGIRDGRTDNG